MTRLNIVVLCLAALLLEPPFALAAPKRSKGAQACPVGQHWVREHYRRGYTEADGRVVSPTTVKGHCRTNPPGYDHWRPFLKNGRPQNWPNPSEKSKEWSTAELERMVAALGRLPRALWIKEIRGFFRMSKSLHDPNPASADREESITLYDSAFGSDRNLDSILAHEVAHIMYSNTPELSKSYRIASGWLDISDDPKVPNYIPLRKDFLKPDGSNSPEEDFANNLEFYLNTPNVLKTRSPGVFLWFQNQFKDFTPKVRGEQ